MLIKLKYLLACSLVSASFALAASAHASSFFGRRPKIEQPLTPSDPVIALTPPAMRNEIDAAARRSSLPALNFVDDSEFFYSSYIVHSGDRVLDYWKNVDGYLVRIKPLELNGHRYSVITVVQREGEQRVHLALDPIAVDPTKNFVPALFSHVRNFVKEEYARRERAVAIAAISKERDFLNGVSTMVIITKDNDLSKIYGVLRVVARGNDPANHLLDVERRLHFQLEEPERTEAVVDGETYPAGDWRELKTLIHSSESPEHLTPYLWLSLSDGGFFEFSQGRKANGVPLQANRFVLETDRGGSRLYPKQIGVKVYREVPSESTYVMTATLPDFKAALGSMAKSLGRDYLNFQSAKPNAFWDLRDIPPYEIFRHIHDLNEADFRGHIQLITASTANRGREWTQFKDRLPYFVLDHREFKNPQIQAAREGLQKLREHFKSVAQFIDGYIISGYMEGSEPVSDSEKRKWMNTIKEVRKDVRDKAREVFLLENPAKPTISRFDSRPAETYELYVWRVFRNLEVLIGELPSVLKTIRTRMRYDLRIQAELARLVAHPSWWLEMRDRMMRGKFWRLMSADEKKIAEAQIEALYKDIAETLVDIRPDLKDATTEGRFIVGHPNGNLDCRRSLVTLASHAPPIGSVSLKLLPAPTTPSLPSH